MLANYTKEHVSKSEIKTLTKVIRVDSERVHFVTLSSTKEKFLLLIHYANVLHYLL